MTLATLLEIIFILEGQTDFLLYWLHLNLPLHVNIYTNSKRAKQARVSQLVAHRLAVPEIRGQTPPWAN